MPIPIRVEDTMMKIFVLVAPTFALIAIAGWTPNKAPDQNAPLIIRCWDMDEGARMGTDQAR